ncbi:MAG: hypothetical protein ACRETN_00155 [Nevskiales bacterium]
MLKSYLLFHSVVLVGTWAKVAYSLLSDYGWNTSFLQVSAAVLVGYVAGCCAVAILFTLFLLRSRGSDATGVSAPQTQ